MVVFNRFLFRFINLIVLVALIYAFGACNQNRSTLKPGNPAIDFRLETVSRESFKLAELKGQKILLHFWADWCTECRAEFPKLQKAHLLLKEQDLKIIAINVGQTQEHVQSFVDYFGTTFPMLMDPDMAIAQQYKIYGLPASVLINRDFTIHQSHLGWLDEKLISEMKEKMK